jgi:hypothetical protein
VRASAFLRVGELWQRDEQWHSETSKEQTVVESLVR